MKYKKYRSTNNANHVSTFLKNFKIFQKSGIHFEKLSDIQIKRISIFLDWFPDDKNLCDWVKNISYMILNDLTNYKNRCKRLMLLPASPSKLSFVLRYGKKEAISRLQTSSSNKTKHFMNRKMYWDKFDISDEEIKDNILNLQKKRSAYMVKKVKGSSLFTCRSIDFWISKGSSLEEAKKEVKKVQARKHSVERNIKWQNTLKSKPIEEINLINLKKAHSIEGIIARGYSNEEANYILKAYNKRRASDSKISNEFFNIINELLPNNNFYYKKKNHEHIINDYYVDFYDPNTKTVIEFYGDYWHRNPLKYDRLFKSHNILTYDVWVKDKKRQKIIEQSELVDNFFIIWESEYKNDKDYAIKCAIEILRK